MYEQGLLIFDFRSFLDDLVIYYYYLFDITFHANLNSLILVLKSI